MTGEALKELLSQPLALLAVMYLGALASAMKTISNAQRDGSEVTLTSYLRHWPETLVAIIAVPMTWAGLLMVDQLNFASAAAFGAVANTSADLIRSGGRSAALSSGDPK